VTAEGTAAVNGSAPLSKQSVFFLLSIYADYWPNDDGNHFSVQICIYEYYPE
jgi:hypothetical protein